MIFPMLDPADFAIVLVILIVGLIWLVHKIVETIEDVQISKHAMLKERYKLEAQVRQNPAPRTVADAVKAKELGSK